MWLPYQFNIELVLMVTTLSKLLNDKDREIAKGFSISICKLQVHVEAYLVSNQMHNIVVFRMHMLVVSL
uniref:Uncharacterized protein n=1 Tax=Physcomitrium patens TaxID=3218 RepID=A0A2K1J212_PHYPA|nr:hypothetical protein PHYPA_023466 [Physcomitrium patens]